MSSRSAPKVFLSYAMSDRKEADKLVQGLHEAGIETWFDRESLVPGENWTDAIKKALDNTNTVLFLIGKGVRESEWQRLEMRQALERSTRDRRYRIVPVLLPGADPQRIPAVLSAYQSIDLRTNVDDRTAVNRLVTSLADDLSTGDPADDETIGDRLRASGDPRAAFPATRKRWQ